MQTVSRVPNLQNDSFFAMNHWFYRLHQADLLFNVDDAADSIIDKSGNPLFTDEECQRLNTAVNRMFAVHGDLVYDVGLKYFRKAVSLPNA